MWGELWGCIGVSEWVFSLTVGLIQWQCQTSTFGQQQSNDANAFGKVCFAVVAFTGVQSEQVEVEETTQHLFCVNRGLVGAC